MVYLLYTFEYDFRKSELNKAKHGISFPEAKMLWNDKNLVEVQAKSIGELRYMVIGKISNIVWSAIITYRGERVRIISVRRARKDEVKFYEENYK